MGTFQAPRVKASHRDWGWFEHIVPWASDKKWHLFVQKSPCQWPYLAGVTALTEAELFPLSPWSYLFNEALLCLPTGTNWGATTQQFTSSEAKIRLSLHSPENPGLSTEELSGVSIPALTQNTFIPTTPLLPPPGIWVCADGHLHVNKSSLHFPIVLVFSVQRFKFSLIYFYADLMLLS